MKAPTFLRAAALLLTLSASLVQADPPTRHFSFNAPSIAGAATGEVFLTGAGTYDLASGHLRASGSFHCLRDIEQGPLAGCRAGDGVRWEGVQLLPSSGFRCSGDTPADVATTDDDTVVMVAEFHRRGEPVATRVSLFVSAGDGAPLVPGTQKAWIQGVGCGEAVAHFH